MCGLNLLKFHCVFHPESFELASIMSEGSTPYQKLPAGSILQCESIDLVN